MSGASPTSLTLRKLREDGYTAEVVERWKNQVTGHIRGTISEPGSAATLPALVEPDWRPNMAEATCLVDDCDAAGWKRGWCKLHYARWCRHGDPLIRSRRVMPSLEERLAAKLIPSVSRGHNGTPCLEWQGSRLPKGYGKISDKRTTRGTGWSLTHRVAYELAFGAIPKNALVCHHCDNPACCNPDHLFLGSHTANVRDMWAKGRQKMPWSNP